MNCAVCTDDRREGMKSACDDLPAMGGAVTVLSGELTDSERTAPLRVVRPVHYGYFEYVAWASLLEADGALVVSDE